MAKDLIIPLSKQKDAVIQRCTRAASITRSTRTVSYTHLTLPTTPYV